MHTGHWEEPGHSLGDHVNLVSWCGSDGLLWLALDYYGWGWIIMAGAGLL